LKIQLVSLFGVLWLHQNLPKKCNVNIKSSKTAVIQPSYVTGQRGFLYNISHYLHYHTCLKKSKPPPQHTPKAQNNFTKPWKTFMKTFFIRRMHWCTKWMTNSMLLVTFLIKILHSKCHKMWPSNLTTIKINYCTSKYKDFEM